MRIRLLVPPVTVDGGRWSDDVEATMARRFVDARGTEWEVWEVGARGAPADASPSAPRPQRDGTPEPSSLRFASATGSRRLARYPAWWEALSVAELAALCAVALPEPPRRPAGGGRSGVNPSSGAGYT